VRLYSYVCVCVLCAATETWPPSMKRSCRSTSIYSRSWRPRKQLLSNFDNR